MLWCGGVGREADCTRGGDVWAAPPNTVLHPAYVPPRTETLRKAPFKRKKNITLCAPPYRCSSLSAPPPPPVSAQDVRFSTLCLSCYATRHHSKACCRSRSVCVCLCERRKDIGVLIYIYTFIFIHLSLYIHIHAFMCDLGVCLHSSSSFSLKIWLIRCCRSVSSYAPDFAFSGRTTTPISARVCGSVHD